MNDKQAEKRAGRNGQEMGKENGQEMGLKRPMKNRQITAGKDTGRADKASGNTVVDLMMLLLILHFENELPARCLQETP